MDPETRRKSGHVWKINRISVQTIKLDSEYTVECEAEELLLTPFGGGTIFSITHSSGSPVYKGRWDNKAQTLDIDMFASDSPRPIKKFEGHHPDKTENDFREYDVEIKDPEVIFKGLIRFSVHHKLLLEGFVSALGSFEAKVFRGAPKSESNPNS